jgi:hypothetical protein
MKHIDAVLSEYSGWVVMVFEQRYGGGFRAVLTHSAFAAQWFEGEMTASGTGIPAADLMLFLEHEGAWLPTAEGETASAALAVLDRKLGDVPEAKDTTDARRDWFCAVVDAINDLRNLRHQSQDFDYWLQEATKNGSLPKAPSCLSRG